MIHTLGTVILACALLFAFFQFLLPFLGWRFQQIYLLATARPLALAQCFCVCAAYLLLTAAFAMNDFSLAYVAANSHPTLPLMYRLSAVWGGHEGSILLWILLLNLWSFAISLRLRHGQTHLLAPLTLSQLGILNAAFLGFLLFTSNPFQLALQRSYGADLNPLLQDPGLVIHPPMLYIGYVGFAVAFALTQAALLTQQLKQTWAQITREFAMAAWCFLTFGITLGSWWAYRVLGWGGFWFWDPVENASLLPWLSGTALIHVLILVEKRHIAKPWAVILALITFLLSLLGTFLVRSGVLISAHTFASDPGRGIFLLLMLGFFVLCALLTALIQLPKQIQSPISFHYLSRETGLILNSIILMIAMLTILLGTLYPLLIDAFHLGSISVGAPYFNQVMTPLLIMLLLLMSIGPRCRFEQQAIKELAVTVAKVFAWSLSLAFLILVSLSSSLNLYALILLTLSLSVIFSALPFYRLLSGMTLAHIGFGFLVIGILLSSLLAEEKNVRMKPGDTLTIAPYQFIFIDTQGIQRDNYRGIQATFEVIKNDRHVTNLYPEKRIYLVRDMVMSKVAIHPGIFRDLYLALGEPLDQQAWSVRVYYKPFIRWIWFGGLLMVLSGVITLWQKLIKKYPS